MNIGEMVTQAICDVKRVKKDQFNPTTSLRDEMGFDDLDIWELLCAIESESQLELDDIEFKKLNTPKEIEDYVATKV